jgi:membrane protein DedA with SNARE-associated domain
LAAWWALSCPESFAAPTAHGTIAAVLAHFVATYGYLAVFLGTLFEGETILVLGGFAAHRGHLSLAVVMAVAFAGSLLGDQTMFWIGHTYGSAIVNRWPSLRKRVDRVRPLLDRFGNVLALFFRFLYGLRNVTPLAMAIGGFSPRKFILLNSAGAAVWAVVVASLGYVLGEAVEVMLPRAHHYETVFFVAIGCALAAFWIVRRIWPRPVAK